MLLLKTHYESMTRYLQQNDLYCLKASTKSDKNTYNTYICVYLKTAYSLVILDNKNKTR